MLATGGWQTEAPQIWSHSPCPFSEKVFIISFLKQRGT
jgi:hypothetical protein